MGRTFVELNQKGFWVADPLLELWLRFAALHIKDSTTPTSESKKIRNQWLLASRGIFNGCVPINLETFLSSAIGEKVIIEAASNLLTQLKASPKFISKDALNLMGMEGKFESDVETQRLILVNQAILDLVSGKIDSNSSDEPLMPGSY